MNPRQRRGVLFLAVAIVGAVAVFFAVVAYVNDVESQVGNRIQGYVLKSDVPAYQPLAADELEKVDIPERWLPSGSISDLGALSGRVTSATLAKGTLLQNSNLVARPSLRAGEREIAILVDAETGVAGKVAPGDRVDVWATFDSQVTGSGPRTKLIAQDLLVINVGLKVNRQKASSGGGVAQTQSVPVTFATAQSQIKALSFAESFATETRLALRPPGDTTQLPGSSRTYEETFGAKSVAKP
jgi:pilus assembly protein CpaB